MGGGRLEREERSRQLFLASETSGWPLMDRMTVIELISATTRSRLKVE